MNVTFPIVFTFSNIRNSIGRLLSYIKRPAIRNLCSHNYISPSCYLANHYGLASHTCSAMDFSTKQITFDKEDWINEYSLHLPVINTVTSERALDAQGTVLLLTHGICNHSVLRGDPSEKYWAAMNIGGFLGHPVTSV